RQPRVPTKQLQPRFGKDQPLREMEGITCRVRAKVPIACETNGVTNCELVALKDCKSLQSKKWAESFIGFLSSYTTENTAIIPRPFDFVLKQDGSIELSSDEEPPPLQQGAAYPAPLRIPAHTFVGLDDEDIKRRAELFALGGLLY